MPKKTLAVLSFALVIALAQAQARQSRPAAPAPPVPPRPPAAQISVDLPDLADLDVDVDVDLSDLGLELADLHATFDSDGPDIWLDQEPSEQDGQGRSESSLYASGMSLMDARRYEQALKMFERVIAKNGKKADGALYWKAYALSRLGRSQEAIAVVDDLTKRFPSTRWAGDARALQLELRQSSGRPVNPSQESDEELKLIALNGLIARDPDRGIPLVEQILTTSTSPRMKERALFVLAQSGSPRAKALLVDVAKGKGNPDLQLKALDYIGAFDRDPDVPLLVSIYRSTSDIDVKRRVIRGLARAGGRRSIGFDFDFGIQEAMQASLQSLENLHLTDGFDEGEIARIAIDTAKVKVDPKLIEESVKQAQEGMKQAQEEMKQAQEEMKQAQEEQGRAREQVQEEYQRAHARAERALQEARVDRREGRPGVREERDKARQLKAKEAADALWMLYQEEASVELKREILRNMHFGDQSDRLAQVARTEKDPQLKRAAVRSLMFDKTPKTTETLVGLYQAEGDATIKRQIVDVLATENTAGPLVQLARRETDPQLRKRIVERLSLMKDKEATDYLLEIIKK